MALRVVWFCLDQFLVAHRTIDWVAVFVLVETLMHSHVLVSIEFLLDPDPDALFME